MIGSRGAGLAELRYALRVDNVLRGAATYADLLALPSEDRAEVLEGVVRVLPGASPEHNRVLVGLSRYIGGPFDDDAEVGGPGGWWIFVGLDVRFGPHMITRPDVVGWRRARLEAPWGKRPIDVVPDWICEVTSPSNGRRDRVEKSRIYLANGVPHYWLIDPEERTLEAYSTHDGYWLQVGVYEESDVARIAPFEAIELPVGRLFPPRPPAPAGP